MRRLLPAALIGALLALAAPALAFEGQSVVDATGRTIEVPADPARVFAAGPPAATLLYALKPDAMIGWVRAPRPDERAFLRPEVRDLPELGRLTGRGDTLNLEVLLTAKPDLVVDFGTISATYADLAERVQQQTGVPYVLIDGALAAMPQAIRQMADVLGVPDRGAELAAYAEAALAETDALLAEVPEDQRPKVYFARGAEGVETAGAGSINAEIITRVGGRNVIEAAGRGLATVSPEQVQALAPDVILATDRDFAENVGRMPEWQGIPAVRNQRVYLVPSAPFGFIDSPPSVNRLIGLKWLAHKLYPAQAKGDLRADVQAFYALFYGMTPDEAELSALLGE
ncbi:iron ABC transporter substrate-binding protein [Sinirhodobacter populi]|uniref:Iron ABC transporter substrate-binding protein n=1 Tax=Paenirhodobacter populi TaxID=2306993 RepID=A0A443KC82_9RHOB|nr:ABC transporter substrate-binding protein [Sinirhodobacter populi]RWR30388.1 iron ABC transporter substrate-binding protein [Sinirhodobacter populi]